MHTDWWQPGILIYEPQADGSLELVAIENLIFEAAWKDAGHDAAPVLNGRSWDHMADDPDTPGDEAHGFAPVFSFGASPAPTITHLQCARDYFTLALLAPHTQGVLRPRIRQAAAADAGRQMADEEVRARLDGDARERGRGIQSGRERPEALVADVYACDRHYGHEPIRLQ